MTDVSPPTTPARARHRGDSTCPHCERGLPAGACYCPGCGAYLSAGDMGEPTIGLEPDRPPRREPGWYADPFLHLPYRWWDGSQWSAYAAGEAVQWDPIPVDDKPPQPPGLRAVDAAPVGFVVGVGLSLLVLVALHWAGGPGGRLLALVLSELGLWAGLVGACLFVTARRGTGSLVEDFGLRVRPLDLGLGLAGSIAARVASSIAILPVVIVHPRFKAPDQSVFQKVTAGPTSWVVLALVVCIGAPLVEELFFRGLVQTRLVGRYGPVIGIMVTSVLFGSAHLIGWQGPLTLVYALAVAGGGVVLGIMRHLTGRLGTSMVAHSMFNAQALIAVALLAS